MTRWRGIAVQWHRQFLTSPGGAVLLESVPETTWPTGPPSEVTHGDNAVRLSWQRGDERTVPLVWLRDNCPCSECRVSSTGEHRYFMGVVDEIPAAASVSLANGALSVAWSDSHTSTYAPGDFARITDIACRSNPPSELWADDFEPERYMRQSIIDDVDSRIEFFAAAVRDGMVIVTDMGFESGECIRFLEQLGLPVRETPFDRLHDVFFRSDGYNVAHTDEPLPPHNDFASYQWPPSGQLIHMLINEVTGGDWINVDGFKVLSELRQAHPDAFATLARVPVGFREHSDTAESWTRAPIVRVDGSGNIEGIRFSNQLMQPMSPTDPELDAFYEAYHLLAKAVMDPANQVTLRGDAGTMQFLHGQRILHSRNGFDGSAGARHLQDTYFDFDDLAALAARTSGQAR